MLAVCGCLASAAGVRAQSIEPRSYSNAPLGVNFPIGYAYTRGGLAADSLPITAAKLATSSAVLPYARILDLGGNSAKFDVIVPYTWLSGTANYLGDSIERKVDFKVPVAESRTALRVNFAGRSTHRAARRRGFRRRRFARAPWREIRKGRLAHASRADPRKRVSTTRRPRR